MTHIHDLKRREPVRHIAPELADLRPGASLLHDRVDLGLRETRLFIEPPG